jgi:hypothetical protein
MKKLSFSDECEKDGGILVTLKYNFGGLLGTVRSAVLYELRLRSAQK